MIMRTFKAGHWFYVHGYIVFTGERAIYIQIRFDSIPIDDISLPAI